MEPQLILELIGYVSSVMILVSLLMTSVVKFRVINAIGSMIFTIYAILISSYPTAALNFCLVAVDLWFLWKVLRNKATFSVERIRAGDGAAAHFLKFYEQDITQFFSGFSREKASRMEGYLVYADANPVGIFLARELEEGVLEVELDYSCPSHRDCSVGNYLYAYLKQERVKKLVACGADQKHEHYLRKMGFVPQNGGFVKHM